MSNTTLITGLSNAIDSPRIANIVHRDIIIKHLIGLARVVDDLLPAPQLNDTDDELFDENGVMLMNPIGFTSRGEWKFNEPLNTLIQILKHQAELALTGGKWYTYLYGYNDMFRKPLHFRHGTYRPDLDDYASIWSIQELAYLMKLVISVRCKHFQKLVFRPEICDLLKNADIANKLYAGVQRSILGTPSMVESEVRNVTSARTSTAGLFKMDGDLLAPRGRLSTISLVPRRHIVQRNLVVV